MVLSWTKNISFLVLKIRANRLGREKRRREGERRNKEEGRKEGERRKKEEKKRRKAKVRNFVRNFVWKLYGIYISLEHLLGMELP